MLVAAGVLLSAQSQQNQACLLTAFYLQSAVLLIQRIPPEIHHTRCRGRYPAESDTIRAEKKV